MTQLPRAESYQGPTFLAPHYGEIRAAHYFWGFKPLVTALGGNFQSLVEEHEISSSALDDNDHPVTNTLATRMLEHCAASLDDNLFGVHLAEYQDPYVFGCLTNLSRAAPTFTAGLEAFARFLPIFHSPGADLAIVSDGQTAEFRWHQHGFGLEQQATLHGLLLATKFLRGLIGNDFHPSYVLCATDVRGRNLPEIETKFGCRIHARSEASAIAFPAALLNRPLATSDPISFHLLGGFLRTLKGVGKCTIVDQVRAQIGWSHSPPGVWTMKRCATKLGMSARALQKRLRSHGVQFSEVVEEHRIETAKRALLETDYTLDEIANHLGYSEQSSFGRAFKRWTNVTPQSFREHRGDA
jgi:AraC-like DNA-binding protein